MAGISKFGDIQGWQKARELTRAVYAITRQGGFSKDFSLKEQMRRACSSIMSNVAEGFARKTNKELSNFLSIAHGSVAELQSQLYIALDQAYLAQSDFDRIYSLAQETFKLIQGFANYLRQGLKPRQGKL